MAYTQTTLVGLINRIAALIDDPTFIQWKYDEIRLAVLEALRMWGGYSLYWRERGAVTSSANNPWYDLSVVLPNLRSRNVTVDSIDREIQYHFFEQANGISGAGMSGQFSNPVILEAINRARNRFALDACMPLTVTQIPVSSPPNGRFELPQDYIYLHRAGWVDSQGVFTTLWREDGWSEDAYNPLWTLTPGTPQAFSVVETPPLQVQLYPEPLGSGEVEAVHVDSKVLNLASNTETLYVPDEWAHAVKYAAMADILSMDGETFDPFRSEYCEQRYQQSVIAAKLFRCVLTARTQNVPIPIVPLQELDAAFPKWRNSRKAKPQVIGALFDLVALSPVPSGQNAGMVFDVVRSAPIPVADSNAVQIGQEDITHIIDYVQHYLSFKLGGKEFKETFGMYDGTLKAIAGRNKILSAQCRYLTALFGQPAKESQIRPDQREVSVA